MKPDADCVSRFGLNEVVDSGSLLLALIYSSKMSEIIEWIRLEGKFLVRKYIGGFFYIFRKLVVEKDCRNYAESCV